MYMQKRILVKKSFTNGLSIGFLSLFNGISTLYWLFNAKAILLEKRGWYYLTHSWEDKRVHTFPKGICPKVNVIARLEYELAYNDSAVHRFNHYTTRTTPALVLLLQTWVVDGLETKWLSDKEKFPGAVISKKHLLNNGRRHNYCFP